jgi:hypothetical protein
MIWLFLGIAASVLGLGSALAYSRSRRPRRGAAAPYAGLGSETVPAPPPSQAAGFDAHLPGAAPGLQLPAGFDVAGFLRAAKEVFIGARDERRDVVMLNAQLLEVATDKGAQVASVHFSGLECGAPGAQASGFEEVWNLVKPVDGSGGWLPAGIQQMH